MVATGSVVGVLRLGGERIFSANAQHLRSRVLVGFKRRRETNGSGVLGPCMKLPDRTGRWPLSQECRSRAAAVGAAGSVCVGVLFARVLAIVERCEFANRFDQICDLHRDGCVGRLLQDEKQPGSTCQVAFGGVPQSVVADFVKPSWQDVLQESSKELDAIQLHIPPAIGAVVLEAERHVGFVHGQDPCVADGNSQDISRQVVEYGVVAVTVVLQERDPLTLPSTGRYGIEDLRLFGLDGIAELGGYSFRQHSHRHKKLTSGGLPVTAVGGDPAAGNQHVDMRVIAQLTRPCVEDGEDARHPAKVTFLDTQFLDRFGRDLHQ